MTLLSPCNPTIQPATTHEQPKRHQSSSAFIAHLLVQEYPPKVQPQSSSARDKALYGHLDKVDAEAGCILIALANHDKRKDMNDLIPYSIRVIDYDRTKTMETTDSPYETLETSPSESTGSSSCSESSISDGAIHDAENDDPSTDEGDSNGTMSIKNLIDVNNESSSSSSDTPALCEKSNPLSQTGQQPSLSPSTSSSSLSSSSLPTTAVPSSSGSLNIQHNDDNDQSKTKSSCKPEPRTDPILLLAAAAKAIDQGELLHQGTNQKRKYSNDDSGDLESRSHSARRPRYTMENQPVLDHPLQSEKSKFSQQYLSMKQNPKIMRNAMHAYISYMIYADLTSSDKLPHHQNQRLTSSSYPTQPASPNSTYTTNHSAFSVLSPPASTFNPHHYPQRKHSSQPHTHYDHPSSSSTPPPINLGGPLNNSIAGNSSIMARPLTAFLRENM